MIGLFFEVTPRIGHEQAYFDIAAGLRPELMKNEGLVFIDRFKSQSRARVVLSHSMWRDEASLARWRTHAQHHVAQVAGRQQHFEDYRLRIGQCVCEWLPNEGDPRQLPENQSYNDPALQQERFMLAVTTQMPHGGVADSEVFASVSRSSEYILVSSPSTRQEGLNAVQILSSRSELSSVRLYLVSRDYGMYDRKEAPQYYPPVEHSDPAC
jgi:heme-degrading monooxygenase HmoA